MIRSAFFLALAALLTLASCNQFDDLADIDRVVYDAEYAIPLVNTSLSIRDLLENFEDNSTLTIDPDGLIHFRYSGEVLSRTADQVFAAINQTLANTGAIPLTGGSQALPFTLPGGLIVDRMDLKAGNLVYLFTNTHNRPVSVTLTVPTAIRNGQPLVLKQNLPAYSGTGDAPRITNLFLPLSLNGYTLLPQNDSIYVNYQVVDDLGNAIPPPQPSLVTISNLAFSYTEGYLGQQFYEGGRDTIYIDFFEQWFRGDVYFEDPEIVFNFQNSFGIPTRSIINVFDVFTVRNEVLPLESDFLTNGVDFPYPLLSEVGQTKEATFSFNKDNSNIREVLGAGPLAIDYDVNAFTNPEAITDIRGFVTDSSEYRVRVDVDLPLYGFATEFAVRDTFEIDFSRYGEVEYVEFKLLTDNGMPLSIDVQGYFLDDNGVVLDSLITTGSDRLMAGATVNAQGIPTATVRTVTYVNFPAERFNGIRQARRLQLIAAFSTTTDGQQSVQVRTDQAVQIRLGAKVGVSN